MFAADALDRKERAREQVSVFWRLLSCMVINGFHVTQISALTSAPELLSAGRFGGLSKVSYSVRKQGG